MNRLLADLETVDVVVVAALDRLGRDMFHVGELFERFEAERVKVESLRETLTDDGSAAAFLGRGMLSLFGDFERRRIAERVRDGIASRSRSGKPWGEPSYGYRTGKDGWVVNASEERIARRIFRLRAQQALSYSGIARKLNGEGVKTRRGAKWTASVVQRLLSGRAVLGEFNHAGEWHRGSHEPIIDPATWEAAQAIGEQESKFTPRGGGGPVPKRHLFVRGFLRCGICGEAMLPRADGDRYVCRTRKQSVARTRARCRRCDGRSWTKRR